MTVVPEAMPVPLTLEPMTTEEATGLDETVTEDEPAVVVAVTQVVDAVMYVGERVGESVGVAEGEAVGDGVGTPTSYVGTKVGEAVGALVGLEDGMGVGLPNLYVGDSVGVPRVGSVVGSAVGEAVVEKMTMIGAETDAGFSVAVLMYTILSTELTAVT